MGDKESENDVQMGAYNSSEFESETDQSCDSDESVIPKKKRKTIDPEILAAVSVAVRKEVLDFKKVLKQTARDQDELFEENSKLRREISILKRKTEYLEVSARQKNLIIHGLQQESNETLQSLFEKVSLFIHELTKKKIKPDIIFRFGKDSTKARPICVEFLSKTDRNLVYENRKNAANKNIFINEDLPFEIRRDHAILRSKGKELHAAGQKNKINFKNRSICTENGTSFQLKNGQLINNQISGDTTVPTTSAESQPSGDSNIRSRKRRVNAGVSFLGDNQQSNHVPMETRMKSKARRNPAKLNKDQISESPTAPEPVGALTTR